MKRLLFIFLGFLMFGCINTEFYENYFTQNLSEAVEHPPISTDLSHLLNYTLEHKENATQLAETEAEPEPPIYKPFHYQLQDVDFQFLLSLNVTYIIVDIDDAVLTKQQIKELNSQGKIVLSYLSIGEAELYRDYWKKEWYENPPSFIDEKNLEWEGNYKVKYWHPVWQTIILYRIQDISEAGYNGVYLDRLDSYEYYAEQGEFQTAERMISFVNYIRERGKKYNPDFLVVSQNAPELYAYANYREIIDGLGKEDTWYADNEIQDEEETSSSLTYLDEALEDGKFILAIDYPTDSSKICDFYRSCSEHGFYCTVSNRELNLDSGLLCK
ncbi:endo alpha-1,4 polygalactosaminidase [Candidatus Micrarchaeota archaeon]|nr:endo alpha-1,4 polygalactosaminidase [Candidatus Micrarchaeota archaeon]